MSALRHGDIPYHFGDMQLHAMRDISPATKISMTAYAGADVFGRGTPSEPTTGGWGNQVVGVTVAHSLSVSDGFRRAMLGDSAQFVQKVSYSHFNALLDVPLGPARGENDVHDARLAGSFARYGAWGATTVGYEAGVQRFSYLTHSDRDQFAGLLPMDSLAQRSRFVGLFADQSWKVSPSLLLDAGVRLDEVALVEHSTISPRLSLKYFVSADVALTLAGGRYTQWVHSLGRQEEPLEPLQFWVMSDSLRPASTVSDAQMGMERWVTPGRLLHVSAFYKKYDDLLVPNRNSNERTPDDSFLRSRGDSYGVDVLLRQLDGGDFSGWLAYAFSVSSRTDALGAHYAPGQDRRHNLDIVGSWRRRSYTFGARIGVGTGLPTTPIIGSFVRSVYDPVTGRWQTSYSGVQGIAAALNSDRLPLYKRVDVSVKRATRWFGVPVVPYISAVNLFNFHNPAGYFYDYDTPPRRTSFPNLPFVPSVGLNVSF